MLYRRNGFPVEDEIVLCKVTKIYPNSVFVSLLEYSRGGIIHISEVSPGRIRNLREFVSIDRQIICKVLRIDQEKGHIDLSIRRVNSHQRQEKLEGIKQELKSEALVKAMSVKLKKDFKKLYLEISKFIFKDYAYIHLAFKEVAENNLKLSDLGIDKPLAKEFEQAIIEKFTPEKIRISGEIELRSNAPDGVEQVKKLLHSVEEVSETIEISYLGAGKYKLIIEDLDYKPAEKNLKEIKKLLEKFSKKGAKAEFVRK